jgi:hypothetical protein
MFKFKGLNTINLVKRAEVFLLDHTTLYKFKALQNFRILR